MQNPSELLYDMRIVSFHDKIPGHVAYAMHRTTGIPTAICREYVNGRFAHEIFVRGVTFVYAKMIQFAVKNAGGEAEMVVCPWTRGL